MPVDEEIIGIHVFVSLKVIHIPVKIFGAGLGGQLNARPRVGSGLGQIGAGHDLDFAQGVHGDAGGEESGATGVVPSGPIESQIVIDCPDSADRWRLDTERASRNVAASLLGNSRQQFDEIHEVAALDHQIADLGSSKRRGHVGALRIEGCDFACYRDGFTGLADFELDTSERQTIA